MFFASLDIDCKPSETAGPIPKANIKVPIPAVPPRVQPKITTVISIHALTSAMGAPVFFCKPVISPSLGPAPRFAIR